MVSTTLLRFSGIITSLILGSLFLSGCGSSRITLEGYDDALLNGKRVFLLTPSEGDYIFTSIDGFTYSRGIASITAQTRIDNEFQSRLRDRLNVTFDSNLVVNYRTQPVGVIHPLNAVTDFFAHPSSWDWTKLEAAGKEGVIDYLIVLRSVTMKNYKPKGDGAMGKEEVDADFVLIDLTRRSVMTQNNVAISVDDPRRIADTYIKLSEKLASKMPFHVKED
ncbi:MAG: hypothetical protein J4G05_01195 [Chlorobi bacterium]|nr:hypothetical protein [Chlorobiota bacterium]